MNKMQVNESPREEKLHWTFAEDMSTQHKHWINGDLLKLYRQRNTLYKRFRQAGTSAAWMAYRQARNCCTAATRVAKRAFFFSARHKPHLFWNKIKKCTGLGKLRQSSLFWPCSTPIISKVSANIINRSLLERISSLQQQQSHTFLLLSTAPAVLRRQKRPPVRLNLRTSHQLKYVDLSVSYLLRHQPDVTQYRLVC